MAELEVMKQGPESAPFIQGVLQKNYDAIGNPWTVIYGKIALAMLIICKWYTMGGLGLGPRAKASECHMTCMANNAFLCSVEESQAPIHSLFLRQVHTYC